MKVAGVGQHVAVLFLTDGSSNSVAANAFRQAVLEDTFVYELIVKQCCCDRRYICCRVGIVGGKGEQNIGIMQEFVDDYSQGSSHATAVAKVNTYLFEYRGLNAKIQIYADIAQAAPLTSN